MKMQGSNFHRISFLANWLSTLRCCKNKVVVSRDVKFQEFTEKKTEVADTPSKYG